MVAPPPYTLRFHVISILGAPPKRVQNTRDRRSDHGHFTGLGSFAGSKKRVSVGPKPEIWTITQRPGPCGQSGCAVAGSEYTLAGGSFLRDLASKWSP